MTIGDKQITPFSPYNLLRQHQYEDYSYNKMTENNKVPHGVAGAPNEASLLELMNRTGYSMIQENGQRKYGGPPPGWEGPAPARGCEIFVGKIPRDCYEDELVPIFERIGRIYELRLMMDFSGTNRGYCFVMYTCRDDAKRAMKELNNFELRKGRYLGVCVSVDNCRLFVGGIPKNKAKEEILCEMKKVTEGVVDVIVYPSAMDKAKNRGFAFVEYESHRAAAMARRKLIPGRIQLFGHQIAVDWAEPEAEVDEDIMSKVKILYIRNLMLTTTEDHLRDLCQTVAGKEGCVERVKKLKDYAFVHFREREDAMIVMERLNDTTIEGSLVEVVLAKPVDKNDYVRYTRGATRGGGLAGQLTYGAQGTMDYQMAAYMSQYQTTVANSTASAMAGMTSLSPHGGFQNRGGLSIRSPLRGRGRGAAGVRGTGGRSYLAARQGSTSYRKNPLEGRLFEIQPDMVLTPTNPITLKPQSIKAPTQMLEDYCSQHGLGTPVFQLLSTMSGEGQLFLYKVSIPAIGHSTSFQPDKLCRTIEEAKQFAAQYVLVQLGAPMEGVTEVAPSPSGSGTPMSPLTPSSLASPATAALYQGRPIGPGPAATSTYALSNGLVAGTHSIHTPAAMTPQTLMSSVPITTAASYAMAPTTKMLQSMQTMQQTPHIDTTYDPYASAAAAAAAAFAIPAYHY